MTDLGPIWYMLFALFATILVKIIVAYLLGYEKRLEIIAIILVSLITNPIINLIILLLMAWERPANFSTLLIFEIIIIIVEWLLLLFTFRKNSKKLLILSFVMNIFSFGIGYFITLFFRNLLFNY